MKLAETHLEEPIKISKPAPPRYAKALEAYEFNLAMDMIWAEIADLDKQIALDQPFVIVRENSEQGKALISKFVQKLYWIGEMLQPFMPATSELIKEVIKSNKMPRSLFPRLD